MINYDPLTLAEIVLRTSVVYIALLIGIRVAGKRELGQMSPFDLVVVLVIANAVQNAMVGSDTSLTGGLLAAFVLLLVNWIVGRLRLHIPWLERDLTGHATLLVNNGHFIESNLRREGVDEDEVYMAMREHGVDKIDQVEIAILEIDGTISIVPKQPGVSHRTRRRVRGRKPRA
ncbi:MAG TPA: YetF domain-containing protein [Nitrolancea sp.]|nr:YetF domain-containing protein [Nitrolancea sp.]